MISLLVDDPGIYNLHQQILLLRRQIADLIQQKNEERTRPQYDPYLDFFSPLDIFFSRVIYELCIAQEQLIDMLYK